MALRLPFALVFTVFFLSLDSLAFVGPRSVAQRAFIEELEHELAENPVDFKIYGRHLWIGAAKLGYTEVLNWLWRNRIPGSGLTTQSGLNPWSIAVAQGHIHVLEWLQIYQIKGRRVIMRNGMNLKDLAAAAHQPEVVRWLEKTPEFELTNTEHQILQSAIPVMYDVFKRASTLNDI